FTLGGALDPQQESLGLMADDAAQVDIRGAGKTAFAALSGGYTAGSSTLTVGGRLSGWRKGDAIEIAPTTFAEGQAIQAERRTLPRPLPPNAGDRPGRRASACELSRRPGERLCRRRLAGVGRR